MLATIGMIVPHFYTLPQYKGLTVLTAHEELVKTGAMQQLLIFIGLFEVRARLTPLSLPAARPRVPPSRDWRAAAGRAPRAPRAPRALSSDRAARLSHSSRRAQTVVGIPAAWATMKGERAPGDFKFGTAFIPSDPALFKRKQLSELKNGRLAMLSFSGMVTQAALTGHDFPFLF